MKIILNNLMIEEIMKRFNFKLLKKDQSRHINLSDPFKKIHIITYFQDEKKNLFLYS